MNSPQRQFPRSRSDIKVNRTFSQISNGVFLVFLILMSADFIAQGAKPVIASTAIRA
jgi:hypothetical protein